MFRITAILLLVFFSMAPVIKIQDVSALATDTRMVINEIQTGGFDELLHEEGRKEFIELHNQTDEVIDISGWRLQYFSASKEDTLVTNSSPTRELASFEGSVNSGGFVLLSYEGYIALADGYFGQGSTATSGLLARSGGHVRLIDAGGNIVDAVGWGSAKSPETKALAEIGPSQSGQRKVVESKPVDTNNNFDDFSLQDTPTPQGGSFVEPIPEEQQELPEEAETPVPKCDGLIISEIFPNPEGEDADKEFIELYNPTNQTVFLEACAIKTSGSSNQYNFPIGLSLAPFAYMAFYENVTGMNLPNAAGGQVLLKGTESDYSIEYPPEMGAGYSWSLIGLSWQQSNQPTPNGKNTQSVETPSDTDTQESLQPCPEGKFRNPETNRCKNIQLVASSLLPCAVGQTRNPATNRCRAISSLTAGLSPCRTGQERNPETNRCRNITSSSQSGCQDGYERNPETNRCRKKSTVLAASSSVGSLPGQTGEKLNYLFLSVMSILVLGYGIYEYRNDIENLIQKLKAKKASKLALKSD